MKPVEMENVLCDQAVVDTTISPNATPSEEESTRLYELGMVTTSLIKAVNGILKYGVVNDFDVNGINIVDRLLGEIRHIHRCNQSSVNCYGAHLLMKNMIKAKVLSGDLMWGYNRYNGPVKRVSLRSYVNAAEWYKEAIDLYKTHYIDSSPSFGCEDGGKTAYNHLIRLFINHDSYFPKDDLKSYLPYLKKVMNKDIPLSYYYVGCLTMYLRGIKDMRRDSLNKSRITAMKPAFRTIGLYYFILGASNGCVLSMRMLALMHYRFDNSKEALELIEKSLNHPNSDITPTYYRVVCSISTDDMRILATKLYMSEGNYVKALEHQLAIPDHINYDRFLECVSAVMCSRIELASIAGMLTSVCELLKHNIINGTTNTPIAAQVVTALYDH